MLLPFLVSSSSASLYETEFTEFDLEFARQDPAEAGDLKLSSPLNSILQSAGKGAGGEVASVAVVHIKSALFGPASATAPVAASSTTSASATGCKLFFLSPSLYERDFTDFRSSVRPPG